MTMLQFRTAIRLLLLILGLAAGIVVALAALFARMIINPPRRRLWATPADLGLSYEEVNFPARDGLRLSGWFIPAKMASNGNAPATLVVVHGWPWNRLGTTAESMLTDLPGSSPLKLLDLAEAMHQRGYNLLMFDLRNHGQSAREAPVTFGLREVSDLLGALDYLANRQDVNSQRIGVIGFSMGANTLLYALSRTDLIAAGIAVQPTSPALFARRYAAEQFGPMGKIGLPLAKLMYGAAGGLRLSAIEPILAVAGAGNTPILYVQGKGDTWGSVENVAQMAAATPNSVEPLYPETQGRFGGYQYLIDHPEAADDFFQQHMS